VAPDELNDHLTTFMVTPMTTGGHAYLFRIPCRFRRKDGFVALDQLRTVDRDRLVQRLGALSSATLAAVLGTLREMSAH
jgi:mRNA interferase MazF